MYLFKQFYVFLNMIPKLAKIAGITVLLFSVFDVYGQQEPIQFSGVILDDQERTYGLPGTHIYVSERGQGTTTNGYGFFSIPVLPGDSVIFSYVGFKVYSFVVPENQVADFKEVIVLEEDTTYLPTVEVRPYLPEDLFKQAILTANLPDAQNFRQMNANLNNQLYNNMISNMPMDGSEAAYYYINSYNRDIQQRNVPQYNPLFNPFAWADVVRSLRRD